MWRALGAQSGQIYREAVGPRQAQRLCEIVPGLLSSLATVGVNVDATQPTAAEVVWSQNLTERERQVLRGISQGKSNAEIDQDLFISEETVKTHARRLYQKLRARDRAHAVTKGFRLGILR